MESVDWLPLQEPYSPMHVHVNATLKNLDDFNHEEFKRRLAPVIFLSVLLIIGFLGNTLVLVLYPLKFPATTNRTFIVGLAIMDLLVCLVTIPFEIVDMVFQYTFYNVTACKLFRSCGLWFSLSSMFVLVGMSYEKYRRICKPFKRQMSVKISRILILVIFIASFVLSSSNIPISGIRLVALGNNITGHDCSLSDRYAHTILPIISEGSLLIVTMLCIISIIILYSLIGKSIVAQNKFRKQFTQNDSRATPIVTLNLARTSGNHDGDATDVERRISSHNHGDVLQSPIRKLTKIAFVVSVVFLISKLPHLVLTFLTAIKGKFLLPPGPVVSAVMPIIARSFIINNVANPIIYGVMDKKFRKYVKCLLLCSFVCRKRH